MTARAYSSTYNYGTTAFFRAWGLQLSTELAAAGLVRAGDTGQINWATVNAPVAINNFAGYEVYRFDDALQATAPVFIKIEYGYGPSLSVPSVAITVGSATLGNGTVSGVVSTRTVLGLQYTNPLPLRPLMTNVCVLPGYVGVAHKRDTANSLVNPNSNFFFAVCRTANDDGTLSGVGVFILTSATAVNTYHQAQCLGFAEGFVSSVHPGFVTFPNGISQNLLTTAVDLNNVQMFKIHGIFPQVRPIVHLALYHRNDALENQIAPFAIQGAVVNDYLMLGLSACRIGWWGEDTNACLAMMYQ